MNVSNPAHMIFSKKLLRLKSRALMYMIDDSYESFINYLLGFDDALIGMGYPSVINEFRSWLQEKNNDTSSLSWHKLIENISKKEKIQATTMMFRLFDAFFEEKLLSK